MKRAFFLQSELLNYIRFYKQIKEYVLSKQLLRSGTSVGALVRESQNAESNTDFIHKSDIARKECDESMYWIELLNKTDYLTDIQFESIFTDVNELLKMIRSAIITTKQKKENHNS